MPKPQLPHFIHFPSPGFGLLFITSTISPLNNLSICVFWLFFSAEAWTWAVLAWTYYSVRKRGWKANMTLMFKSFFGEPEWETAFYGTLVSGFQMCIISWWYLKLYTVKCVCIFVSVWSDSSDPCLLFLTTLFHLITISFARLHSSVSDSSLIHFFSSQC